MILLEPFPSASVNADVQEAGSRRYGPAVLRLLPLISGKIAVLSPFYDLIAIVDSLEEAISLTALANTYVRPRAAQVATYYEKECETKKNSCIPRAAIDLGDMEI